MALVKQDDPKRLELLVKFHKGVREQDVKFIEEVAKNFRGTLSAELRHGKIYVCDVCGCWLNEREYDMYPFCFYCDTTMKE